MLELLWLLLPLAAASGWWMARRECAGCQGSCTKSNHYFKGLNYLLDDKPDEAIKVIGTISEVDGDTAETHLALGNLFRRRGEVDQAIHIHSSLITETKLTVQQRNQAMLELGEDYLRAGLFDRAETLFQKLIEHPEHSPIALARLIDIYQQEKDWQQAIFFCDHLERRTGLSKKAEIAHFCCELAEEAMHRNDVREAREFLEQALDRDSHCVRANILRGHLAMRGGDYQAAMAAFQAVECQDRYFFPEVIDPLGQCYAVLGRQGEWVQYLQKVQACDHSGYVTAALAELLVQWEGEDAALRFLENELRDYPTALGLRCFIELKLAQKNSNAHVDLDVLYHISEHRLSSINHYRCDNCGFTAKSLHWCCPSCKTWDSIQLAADRICGNHS